MGLLEEMEKSGGVKGGQKSDYKNRERLKKEWQERVKEKTSPQRLMKNNSKTIQFCCRSIIISPVIIYAKLKKNYNFKLVIYHYSIYTP